MDVLSTNVRLAFVKGDTMGPTNVGVPRHQTFYVPSSSSCPFPDQVAPWFAGRNDQKCQGSSNGSQVTERSTVRGILVQKWPYLPVFPSDGSNCSALVALLQPSMGQIFLDLVGFFPEAPFFLVGAIPWPGQTVLKGGSVQVVWFLFAILLIIKKRAWPKKSFESVQSTQNDLKKPAVGPSVNLDGEPKSCKTEGTLAVSGKSLLVDPPALQF